MALFFNGSSDMVADAIKTLKIKNLIKVSYDNKKAVSTFEINQECHR
jgi:hypothetical protein